MTRVVPFTTLRVDMNSLEFLQSLYRDLKQLFMDKFERFNKLDSSGVAASSHTSLQSSAAAKALALAVSNCNNKQMSDGGGGMAAAVAEATIKSNGPNRKNPNVDKRTTTNQTVRAPRSSFYNRSSVYNQLQQPFDDDEDYGPLTSNHWQPPPSTTITTDNNSNEKVMITDDDLKSLSRSLSWSPPNVDLQQHQQQRSNGGHNSSSIGGGSRHHHHHHHSYHNQSSSENRIKNSKSNRSPNNVYILIYIYIYKIYNINLFYNIPMSSRTFDI